ncbi:serine/threonine-protein kinase BLUS1 [Silene latifolia]|uniref:serine/threonine-protein kinase BLUS1 n=1 Tax=Silene latifolia TaxID=37657 RepID=UPI003D775A9C
MSKDYPPDPKSYQIIAEIGSGVSAIVYKAICLTMPPSSSSSIVAIKSIDVDQSRADLDSLRLETKTMSLLSHPNILRAHCSFTVDHRIWVVMPFMSAGSVQSIIASNFPTGLPETCIALVLRETLKALSYLHDQGHVHRDVKAGNILVDSDGSVKLGDFGVSAPVYDTNFDSRLKEVAGTPYWMAPEVIHSHNGYGFKADIWSFGITALELAHGRPPLSHLPPNKSLLFKITKRFRFSDYDRAGGSGDGGASLKGGLRKKFSKYFQDMVGLCLDQDPSKRPTAEKLLRHGFFKGSKSCDFLIKNVLVGLPSVEERFKKSKMVRLPSVGSTCSTEEDEAGEFVRQRRVSGWNFNVEGFELDPVYPVPGQGQGQGQIHGQGRVYGIPDGLRRVRFQGELMIPSRKVELEVLSLGSSPVVSTPTEEMSAVGLVEGISQESSQPSGELTEGGVDRESVMGGLVALRRSLDEQRKTVKELIGFLGGEESGGSETNKEELVEMVERLRRELEQERRKNKELLMELEFLKVIVSGESQVDEI